MAEFNQLGHVTNSPLRYELPVGACPVALAGHLAIGRADQTNSRYLGVSLRLSTFLAEPALRRFGYVFNLSRFLGIHKFPLKEPHFFKQQINVLLNTLDAAIT